jgi:predicted enzyme related to lactoylglutathione lyase
MSDDRYIPGVPCWLDTARSDPEAAMAFYGGLFGWTFEDAMPPGSPGRYHVASIGGGSVAAIASPAEAGASPTWDMDVRVADADASAARVREAGGTVLREPYDVGPFGRAAVVADPAGATFSLWQAREHRGADVVNEHGSVNFNTLHTRDAAGAAAFYGAVFGWEPLDIGAGFQAWALDGYGDFLESRTPGMREAMASMGAPQRFEDVVASLMPIAEDDRDTPEHWGVVFAVNDADAIAERATELGAEVLVPPFDAPWVRTTVLRDPQGAELTASQFKPENRDRPA